MAYELNIVVVFVVILIIFRFMGKRTLSQLTNYDMASIFIIGTVASGPLLTVDIWKAVYGLIILLLLHLGVIILSRNHRIRNYIFGEPKILIEKGKVSRKMLKSAKLTLPQLIDELRQLGYYNVADVEFAILENTGKITTVSRDSKKGHDPPKDKVQREMQLPLIMDGKIIPENIKYGQYDMGWLRSALEKKEIFDTEHVSLATVDKYGSLHVKQYDH